MPKLFAAIDETNDGMYLAFVVGNEESISANVKVLPTNFTHISSTLYNKPQKKMIVSSLGVIFAIYFYTPFLLSIPLAITAFIFLNFYLRKKIVKRMNTIGNTIGSSNASSLIYSCINSGTRHNETACPKYGSKMKKADFHRF
jgi:hypothetical protein